MNKKHCFLLINLFLLSYISWPCNSKELRDFKSEISRKLKYIDDPSPISRKTAITDLGILYEHERIGITDPELHIRKQEIITVIKKCLTDENIAVRRASMIALIRIDTDTIKGFMPSLIEILKDREEEKYKKRAIAEYLKYVGADARDAVPALIELLKKAKDTLYVETYMDVLESIGTPEALESIKPFKQRQERRIKIITLLMKPWVEFLIALCYILFFLWSILLRRRGKKVFHWFIIIPILWYAANSFALPNALDGLVVRQIFIFFALISLGPWLVSWFVYREKLRTKFLSYSLYIFFVFLIWYFVLSLRH